MLKISLVIPAFNEEDTITDVLAELDTYMLKYMGGSDWEVVVVNDGSADNTLHVLNEISKKNTKLTVVDLGVHVGRGRALRAGLDAACGEIIVSLDADLSYAPYHIERLVQKLQSEHADIVLASAYGKKGTAKNVPWNRLWISKLGNRVLAYMFGGGLTVLTCVVRAYKQDFIKRLDLHSSDKEIHLEILYKARILGGKIVEIPADLHWRDKKLAKISAATCSRRRSTLRIKETSFSHLFFALLNKPGLIFWIPGNILLTISFIIFLMTITTILHNMTSFSSLYHAVRLSMLNSAPSWLTMFGGFMLGIQFLTLGFIANQTKRNHDEMYKTVSAVYAELKKINKQ